MDVGEKLRQVRKIHRLTQRELARRSGVNHATISLIEQNKSSPSVGLLKRLLDGVPLSLSAFFAEKGPEAEAPFLYRASDLTQLAGDPLITLKQVGRDLSDRAVQIMHERYHPGADTGEELLQHEGEEGGIVIRGKLEVTVGSQSRILEQGDAYYFDSRTPHRFRNAWDEVTEYISACSPPSF
ncbi:MAG: cupin domain-containing protein [Kiloniellales bacterium]